MKPQETKTIAALNDLYRVSGQGHHYTTFEALGLALGPSVSERIAYFDTCRLKRNHVDYDYAEVASDSEADELLEQAKEFRKQVESWIHKNHPALFSAT